MQTPLCTPQYVHMHYQCYRKYTRKCKYNMIYHIISYHIIIKSIHVCFLVVVTKISKVKGIVKLAAEPLKQLNGT